MVLEHRNLSKMLETAIVAARLAGQLALEEISYLKVSVKNNTELVTQADSKCQQIIIDRIRETYPDHGFIAEEGIDGNIFKLSPRCPDQIWWVIDPIDGTNNFAHQIPLFSVSIAAMYQGNPIVGVIFDPATDSVFTAVKDTEAELNGRKITVTEEKMDRFSSIAIDSHFKQGIPNWACQIMQKTKFRNLGSTTLHFAYVARGSLVGTVIHQPKLWDFAAGALIAETAGAIVTDWQGKKLFPIDLDAYNGQEIPLIMANPETHSILLELLKS